MRTIVAESSASAEPLRIAPVTMDGLREQAESNRWRAEIEGLATGQTQAKADKLAAVRPRAVGRRQGMASGLPRERTVTTKAQRPRRQHKGERRGAVGAPSNLGGEAALMPERRAEPFGVMQGCWD